MGPRPNAPAFPCVSVHDVYLGMCLRTYLAAQALHGLCGRLDDEDVYRTDPQDSGRLVGNLAVAIADATLAAMGHQEGTSYQSGEGVSS